MKELAIGERMKSYYESRYRLKLTRRTPVVIRLDGNCFHTLTKDCKKPFDIQLSRAMEETARNLCAYIQGTRCSYIQSDEISILLTDFENLDTEAWFDYNVQKMCSVSAGKASVFFTDYYGKEGIFDSRVFNIPKEEVCNYFVWRQADWERNSLIMYARSFYTQEKLHKKGRGDLHEMLHQKGHNWAGLEDRWKNGLFISRSEDGWITHPECPIFKTDRISVEKYLYE